MEFDKSKVYTALNADEVKVGSKGIFANTVYELQKFVAEEKTITGAHIKKLVSIMPDDFQARFNGSSMSFPIVFSLFYLVEEQEEEKWRPYKDTYEMIKDFCIRFKKGFAGYELPHIKIKSKVGKKINRCFTSFSANNVFFGITPVCFGTLLENYTYLDGSPCGIKED